MKARELTSGHIPRVMILCVRCGGSHWCCEAHPDKPEHHRDTAGDQCRAAGIPCPSCGRTDLAPARNV